MKHIGMTASVVLALVIAASASTPEQAQAKEADSVCQFYKGDPLCKTVEETSCIGGSLGVEGSYCRKTTEYWYWS